MPDKKNTRTKKMPDKKNTKTKRRHIFFRSKELSTHKKTGLHNEGSATLTVFILIVLLLPLLLSYGLYLQQRNKLLGVQLEVQKNILELKHASDVLSAAMTVSMAGAMTAQLQSMPWALQDQYRAYTMTIEDLSGNINPYFTQDILLDLQLFDLESAHAFSASQILTQRKNLKKFTLIEDYIPASIQKYFSEYSYININTDSIEMMEAVLAYNNIDQIIIDKFISVVKTRREEKQYIDQRELESLKDIVRHEISDVFSVDAQININSIDLALLDAIINYASFNVLDTEEALSEIARLRREKIYIDEYMFRDIIKTSLGADLFFYYVGTEGWHYKLRVCKENLCNVRILRRELSYASNGLSKLVVIKESIEDEKIL